MYDEKHALQSTVKKIDCRLLDVTEIVLIKTLLFGNFSIDAHIHTQIFNASIMYIETKDFRNLCFILNQSFSFI